MNHYKNLNGYNYKRTFPLIKLSGIGPKENIILKVNIN